MPQDVVRLIIRRLSANPTAQTGAATVPAGGSTVAATTGGGPRDIRWQEHACGSLIGKMFKGRVPQPGRDDDYVGQVNFIPTGHGSAARHQLTFDAPKPGGARKERRLLTNSAVGFDLAPYLVADPNGGASFVLIFETDNGALWLRMTTQTELESGLWDSRVRETALGLLGNGASACQDFAPTGSSAVALIENLSNYGNVLLSGAPGTGKSRLMSEVRRIFHEGMGAFSPSFDRTTGVIGPPEPRPIPSIGANPKTFSFPMHQSARHSDFMTKRVPNLAGGWDVDTGPLYEAIQHAKSPGGHSLLLLDELNRGPAAEVLGPALVALDQQARSDKGGNPQITTQFFRAIDPLTGRSADFALPENLWILAGRNTADVSATKLDSALLRRFHEVELVPNARLLRQHFRLNGQSDARSELLSSMIAAFESINSRIQRTDEPGCTVGHGLLMQGPPAAAYSYHEAQRAALEGWSRMMTHLREVFRGREQVVGAILGIGRSDNHPLALVEDDFADLYQTRITGEEKIRGENIEELFRAIANLNDATVVTAAATAQP